MTEAQRRSEVSMPYRPYAARRPTGVTVVIALTLLISALSLLNGVLSVTDGSARVAGVWLDPPAAPALGWAEIAFGCVTALVAVGLIGRSHLARLLVSVLMVGRIVAAVWTWLQTSSGGGWVAPAVSAGIAVLVLLLLFNAQADAYFNR